VTGAASSPAAAIHAAADPNPEQGVVAALVGGIAVAIALRLLSGRGDDA